MSLTTMDKVHTLLVVDDEPINLRVMYELLKEDYEVLAAGSMRAALAVCERQRPDLVLLDIEMPEVDGLEGFKMFGAMPTMADVPIIFVTAHGTPEQEEQCFEYGGADFIATPVSPRVLRARVRNQLTLADQARQLRELALIDGLTGVANRRSFEQYVDQEFRACRRERASLALVLVDVDCFKLYNDNYGHQGGDDALQTVASIIRDALRRPRDLVARYGGEEFVCVLPYTGLAGAACVAENVRRSIDAADIEHVVSRVKSNITVSVGIAAAVPEVGQSPADLIEAADRGLYKAKAAGRNQVSSLTTPPVAIIAESAEG